MCVLMKKVLSVNQHKSCSRAQRASAESASPPGAVCVLRAGCRDTVNPESGRAPSFVVCVMRAGRLDTVNARVGGGGGRPLLWF